MQNKNINLVYVPMKKLKTTTIGVYIHRNLNDREVSKNALLPYVLKQGCMLSPDSESIAKYLEGLYGATLGAGVEKFGDDQVLRFEATTISDRYAAEREPLTENLLKLILSVMFEPVTENGGFKKQIVDIEKKNAKDRIMSLINEKRQYAQQKCIEHMCEGEVYALGMYGTSEGVDEVDEKSLYEYYKSAITSSVINIYVCGDADEDKLRAIIEEKTEGLSFNDAEISRAGVHANGGEVKSVTEKLDVNQGNLAIGFTTDISADSDEYFALSVMQSVFGAGAHSKLFNNVREKLSLAYYAGCFLIKSKGIILVSAGIEFKNFQKAYDETLAQLKAIQDGDISELEYKSSVNSIINNLESRSDNPSAMHNFMVQQRVYGTNYDIDYVKERTKAVTVEDIVRVSKKVKLDTVYFLTGKGEE